MPGASSRADLPGLRRVWIAGLALFAVMLLGLQIWWVGPAAVASTLAQLDPLAAAFSLLAIVLGALVSGTNAWWLAMRSEGVGYGRFLSHYWTGWSVGLILPGQVGDALTISLLLRQQQIPLSRSLAGLGIDKLLSLLVALAAVCALPVVFTDSAVGTAAIGLIAALVAMLFALAAAERWLAARVALISGRLLKHAVDAMLHAGQLLRVRPGVVVANLLLSLLKLGLTGLSYWYALQAMGQPMAWAQWPAVTLCAAAAGLVAYVPVSLNGIGTVELTGIALFGALGLPAAAILGSYLWLRFATLFAAFLPVLVMLAVARLRQTRRRPDHGPDPP